jgi:N-acetylglucosaminyldiphosphoundecaprenol N-acetyl-beta-D-mannosaminyltransferase
MKYSSIPFFNYTLFNDSLSKLISSEQLLISTINQYSFCIAQEDSDFKKVLAHSDVLLPDGVAVTAATYFLTGRRVKKIAGSDLHTFLLKYLNEKNGKCFYLGSSQDTLNKVKERLEREYPNIRANFYAPPYKAVFSPAESQQMIEQVNAFKPEVLFIGMTAPKQEKWAYQHRDALDARLICSIGAVFDFYAGTVKRPGSIWINLGLEWLGRLLKEPRRLWKRYLYYGPKYIGRIIIEKWKFIFSNKQQLHS